MAEIPVERKSGMPRWLWLVLAALVLLMLFWIFFDNDPEPVETAIVAPVALPAAVVPVAEPGVSPSVPSGNASSPTASPTASGAITDLATLTSADDVTSMIGREVRLTTVPVTAMAGDRTFFVGEGANRLFVLLPEGRSGLPSEDSVNVNEGQMVTLSGTLRRAQDAFGGRTVEGLPAGTSAVLVADNVQIASR